MKSCRPTILALAILLFDCTNIKATAIRTSGKAGMRVRVEEATTWLAECLLAGQSAECRPSLHAAGTPSFDVGSLTYLNDALELRVSGDECVKMIHVGRIIGHFVLTNPNDASLEKLEELPGHHWTANRWRLYLDPIVWRRTAKAGERWASDRVVMELKQYQGFGLEGQISSLPPTPPYEREAKSLGDSAFCLALTAQGLEDLSLPSPLQNAWEAVALSAVLPYSGTVAFITEFVEFRDEKDDPLGCQPVFAP